jgi:hypothetical protein
MNKKEAQLLMETTRKELAELRERAIKNKSKFKFPIHIWENIAKLKASYSRSEIISTLSLP